MKVCHIADIHWRGLRRHEEFKKVFTDLFLDAKSQKVDRIVVAGDIVHTKTMGISPELIKHLTWWFTELAEVAPTIVTLGNHDGLILNKSRLDTISPIIETLKNDRIIFLRDSSQWHDEEFDVVWSNFSCFDEENWSSIKPHHEKINIALFHGAIKKSTTDIGWELDSECDMSLFNGFDFGMFGDIHKYQYLDDQNRFAYPGSTIQQDFSEEIDKGYLFWDIESKEKFTSSRRIIPSPNPFYTIEWMGTAELTHNECSTIRPNCRLRISSDSQISQEEIKKFSNLIKSSHTPEEIAWKISEKQISSNIIIGDSSIEHSSLRDANFHTKALREFHGEDKLLDNEWSSVDNIISNVIHSFETVESNRNTKWSIKNMEWENTFVYGKGNRIDFSSLEGIVGLFGINRCGKSSIPGTIMYSLFNDTDRGSISNMHVINARKGDCEARVEFELNGNLYRVERMSYKWSNPKGSGANTKMNLYRISEDGEIIEDITGEQRRDSDKILRQLIGEPSDFLLTSFASQGEMGAFIKSGATDRKKLLGNFLDLGIFDQIMAKLKEESAGMKSSLKNQNLDYDELMSACSKNIDDFHAEKKSLENSISSLKSKEIQIRINLATAKNGATGYTKSDVVQKKAEIESLNQKISSYDIKIKEIDQKIEKFSNKLEKIDHIKGNFPIESLKQQLSSLRELELSEAKLSSELEKEQEKLRNQKKSVARLMEVPCGDQFPTCKFIKDSHRDKQLIEEQGILIKELSERLEVANKSINDIKSRSLEEKLQKYEMILREEVSLDANISNLELEKKSYVSKTVETLKKVKESEEKLTEMSLNVMDEDTSEAIEELESDLFETTKILKEKEASLMKTERSIGSEMMSLEKYEHEKVHYQKKSQLWKIYDLLIQSYGKNGLPQSVLSQKLPAINNEIASILQGTCGFTVSLVSSGSDLEINIDYGDSQRPIELGSGMEKMMASLAIRVALINISSLPKSDMFIIDEGFGALDDVNIEACNRLLVSLKRFFKTIIVISHVDAIKDAVDNIIEISRSGQDSHVWA